MALPRRRTRLRGTTMAIIIMATITTMGNTVLSADVAELKSIWKHGLTPFY